MKAEESLVMMFNGLVMHYAKAIADGRTKEWADAGHSIIDLMATCHRVETMKHQ
jgi:hypothetical protein